MGKLSREERKPIYDLIHLLCILEESGWDMTRHLKACGDALCSDNRPQYRQPGLTDTDYYYFLGVARFNKIPVRVYKDRLRRGKPASEAATVPYFKKSERRDAEWLELAEQHGITPQNYYYRRRRGWSKHDAATKPLHRVLNKK